MQCSKKTNKQNFNVNLLLLSSSWEARLASLYSKAQQTPPSCSSSSSQPAGTSWFSSLHHLVSHQAPFSTHSRVPHGGSVVTFSVPESSAPSLLTVSKFSAQLTFISPGNKKTTVSLWDFESGRVKYHQTEGEAAPVQRCGERQHRLVLKSKSSSCSLQNETGLKIVFNPTSHGMISLSFKLLQSPFTVIRCSIGHFCYC